MGGDAIPPGPQDTAGPVPVPGSEDCGRLLLVALVS